MEKQLINIIKFAILILLVFKENMIFSQAIPYQSFSIYKGDTINIIDANGLKVGKWIVFGKDVSKPDYSPEQIVEEGVYVNNKKEGLWISYYPNGMKKSEITYKNGRPNGPYKLYYENGVVQEEGTWGGNKNTGSFKRYYPSGKVQQEFNFNEAGKREGIQKYYYENGQVMIEGEWKDGKEQGEIKEYYEDGSLKAIRVFEDGKFNPEKSKELPPSSPKQIIASKPPEPEKEVIPPPPPPTAEEKPNIGEFTGNGFFILYNKNKQISQKGEFKNGKLWNGKLYNYDKNGLLVRVAVYKDGKYIGDAPLEQELKELNLGLPK